jgi:hypothetical protein
MLDLSLNFGKEPVLLRDTARRQDVSENIYNILPLPFATLVWD